MKGCIFFVIILFFAAIAALAYLQRMGPPEILQKDPHVQPHERPEVRPPEIDPEEYVRGNPLNRFERLETPDTYQVRYTFADYRANTRTVACNVARQDHQAQLSSYGYDYDAIREEMDKKLRKSVAAYLKKLKLHNNTTIKIYGGGGYEYQYQGLPYSDPGYSEMEKSYSLFQVWMKHDFPKLVDQYERELFAQRGFRIKNNKIEIDYPNVIEKNLHTVESCGRALLTSAGSYSFRQKLGLLLAFFQEIKYEKPPDIIDGKKTLGLWMPTEVLANNHGDCDSKSVAFAAICKRGGMNVAMITTPEHALIGIEQKPGPGQEYVLIKNRYYVLCEVAGPGKYAPGTVGDPSIKGAFEYDLL